MENQQTEKISNIRFVRLITGEDLVSEIVYSEDMGGIVLYNPMKVIYMANDASVSLTLMEWIFSSVCEKQLFPMSSANIMVMSEVSSGLEQMYWTMLAKIALKMQQKEQDGLLEVIDEENLPEPELPTSAKSYIQQVEEEMLLDIQSGKRKLN